MRPLHILDEALLSLLLTAAGTETPEGHRQALEDPVLNSTSLASPNVLRTSEMRIPPPYDTAALNLLPGTFWVQTQYRYRR